VARRRRVVAGRLAVPARLRGAR